MKGTSTSKEYVGGNIEYFDWIDSNKIQMLYLCGFAEELGLKEIERLRFWRKIESNSSKDRYLENDADILAIKKNIPGNHEVEIYIAYECDDGSPSNCETGSDIDIEAEDEEGVEDDEGAENEEGGGSNDVDD